MASFLWETKAIEDENEIQDHDLYAARVYQWNLWLGNVWFAGTLVEEPLQGTGFDRYTEIRVCQMRWKIKVWNFRISLETLKHVSSWNIV